MRRHWHGQALRQQKLRERLLRDGRAEFISKIRVMVGQCQSAGVHPPAFGVQIRLQEGMTMDEWSAGARADDRERSGHFFDLNRYPVQQLANRRYRKWRRKQIALHFVDALYRGNQ
jgi:hypothetical protein